MSDFDDDAAAVDGDVLHPRIRERRAEVEDAQLRSRNRKLMAVAVIVLAGLLAFAATQSPLLDVDEVRVIGAQRAPAEFFREVAAVELGTPVLGFDSDEIDARLRALPEIRDVRVSPAWDGVVTIEVSERLPVARIDTIDGAVILGGDGIVIEVVSRPQFELDQPSSDESEVDTTGEPLAADIELTEELAALPEITGAMFTIDEGERVPDVLGDAVLVATELPLDIRRVVEQIELTVDSLVLRVVGGGAISLGDARDLDTKFDAVRAFLLQVDLTCLNTLNVAAPTVPVIVRNSGC